jgi:hypothetical protein
MSLDLRQLEQPFRHRVLKMLQQEGRFDEVLIRKRLARDAGRGADIADIPNAEQGILETDARLVERGTLMQDCRLSLSDRMTRPWRMVGFSGRQMPTRFISSGGYRSPAAAPAGNARSSPSRSS